MQGIVQPDRMVKIEMEAAEALADLAQLASVGSGSGASRAGKRIKTESSPSDSELNPVDSVPSCPDLAQHEIPHTMNSHAKSEQSSQPLDQSHICIRNHLSLGGGRPRQLLSEAEKEAKRLRRVLANRESARRTIRRRQALCEELTRKATELSEENEKLKRGKEEALREFQFLETRNKHLKAEMVRASSYNVMGTTKAKAKHGQTELPTPLVNFPVLLPNTLFAPCVWPPVFQGASCKPDIPHEHNLPSFSSPRNPVYILPYTMFFTLPNQGHHSEYKKSEEGENPVDNSHDGSAASSRGESVLPASVKPDKALSTTRAGILNDLNEIPVESPVDLDEQDTGLNCSDPEQANTAGLEVPSPGDPDALTESVSSSGDKKTAGAFAAAEARRRRKELTRLKALHGRQCQTHC
ncbi:hypothetical protein SAY87_008048 [Trapa incisa]|uniref:BZIP domain-containing protein n=1 Tax=Trapa incisa TaxID=236973 RepID=A0AAN7KG18_9MYRT|nr:hypothetical protein SAY87_008048 [Trapa incisa]